MSSRVKSNMIIDKKNILQNYTNNDNCAKDQSFWITGQNSSAKIRDWGELDTNPMLYKEICVNEQSENFTKFVHRLLDKEFYCTNPKGVEISKDFLNLYDYQNILIQQCNDSALCIDRVGVVDLYNCQTTYLNLVDNIVKLSIAAVPLVGALSYFAFSNVETSGWGPVFPTHDSI